MNKIIVNKNIISSDLDNLRIDGNIITFLEDSDYEIEYIDSDKIEITFIVNNDVRLLESSFDNSLVVNNKYIINDGSLSVVKFYNNSNVDENIDIDLCNEKSKIDYKFSNICRCDENYTININHKCKNTISSINNKSIALSNSKIKFTINSRVFDDCDGSALDQNTRIVTMGDSDCKIEPNMYIDLDDVEAKHGSVIGTFKDEQVFYLMSKGISYNDTLKLLIKGYLFSNIPNNGDIKKRIMDIIDVYWR